MLPRCELYHISYLLVRYFVMCYIDFSIFARRFNMDNLNENRDIFEQDIIEDKPLTDEEILNEKDENEEDSFLGGGDHTYVLKADKYDDVRSSSFTMLIVGMLGLIFIILNLTKVIKIPFNPTTAWMFYGIMGVVFVAFLVGGLISFMRANKLKDEAEIENKKIDEINEWAEENLTQDAIDSGLDTNETVEILYFSRAEKIKSLLMHQFEDVDEGLIDLLTENAYTKIYEENEE